VSITGTPILKTLTLNKKSSSKPMYYPSQDRGIVIFIYHPQMKRKSCREGNTSIFQGYLSVGSLVLIPTLSEM
jgi:hypothetical protein